MTQAPKDPILDSDRADILNREQRERLEREQAETKQMHENAVNAVTAANFASQEQQPQEQGKAAAQEEIDERSAQASADESTRIYDGRHIAQEIPQAEQYTPTPTNTFTEVGPQEQGPPASMEPTREAEPAPELDDREARKQAALDKLRADREAARENER